MARAAAAGRSKAEQKAAVRVDAPAASPPLGRILSKAQFWTLMERWQVPDTTALRLIDFPSTIAASGRRPRQRFSTHQQRITSFLPEIDRALSAAGESPVWLRRRNRAAPFRGRTPLEYMAAEGTTGIAQVLRFLNRAAMQSALAGEDI